ncbi:hypothetical protein [Actinosynnema sp. NPDC020468]|uniref:hypothetical protein n=1 Tax=Actinosynnema sp. NPDC020468 TaxID=3154488 RepID=UPI0033CF2BCA
MEAVRNPKPLVITGAVVLLALVVLSVASWFLGPARATGGVYRVVAPDFVITSYDLACADDGATARCAVPVDGAELAITIVLGDTAWDPCHATHRGVDLVCQRTKSYGPGSDTVWLNGLRVPPEEAARWREAVPWWTAVGEDDWLHAGWSLCGALGLVAGLLGRRVLPGFPGLFAGFIALVGTFLFSAFAVAMVGASAGIVD